MRRGRRTGQMVVAAVLMIGLMVMAVLVTVFQAHSLFLRTRGLVVREVIAAITADFKRALAVTLAAATQAYFNYSDFENFLSRFAPYGLTAYNRHNFTVARMAALTYLEQWRQAVMRAYGEYGIQVSYEILQLDLSRDLGRPRYARGLLSGYWYMPTSGSYAYAKLKVNLTSAGFYGWESDVFVGVTLTVYRDAFTVTSTNSTIKINVRVDGEIDYRTRPPSVNGTPYGALVAKGWVKVYYPERDAQGRYTGGWLQARVVDVTYEGFGNYSVTFEPRVDPLTDVNGKQYLPVMVVISDERGILVEGTTYSYILFAVERRTPNTLVYYDSGGTLRTLARPSSISHEVYTLEMSANLSLYWLAQKLSVDPSLKLPPFPFIPIKQIRVNISSDGTLQTLRERPIQYEFWRVVNWHGIQIDWPASLADPQADFLKEFRDPLTGRVYVPRVVFQVQYPSTSVTRQYVLLWWLDDISAEPAVYPSQIRFIKDQTHKDVWHPLYDVEFVDVEHTTSRGYVSYDGVAAIVLRDPNSDFAFGPYNLHAFDTYGSSLGRYRPYGNWSVYYNYMRYSYIQAPIRIFATLNTSKVGNVYAAGDTREDYYDTLALVQIVNGTRYIPVITYIYWKSSKSGAGYWMNTEMGRGIADYFLYLTAGLTAIGSQQRANWTYQSPFPFRDTPSVECYSDPGIMITHWDLGTQRGRAVILNLAGVNLLRNIGGTNARFCVTKSAPGGQRQGSVEYAFWDSTKNLQVSQGNLLSFWTVILDYARSGPGFNSEQDTTMWRNAYVYAPMFLEKYAPVVKPP
ncbi:MAG: hypothetical protein QXI90_03295 [Thermofilum sp.]